MKKCLYCGGESGSMYKGTIHKPDGTALSGDVHASKMECVDNLYIENDNLRSRIDELEKENTRLAKFKDSIINRINAVRD